MIGHSPLELSSAQRSMLSQLERLREALAQVHVLRRALLSMGAALVTSMLLVASLVLFPSLPAVMIAVAALTAAGFVWWRTRSPAPTVTRAALWLEEQSTVRDGTPDFALTTAAEMLERGETLPTRLNDAVQAGLNAAPVRTALAAERRRAWRWPFVFVVLCFALLVAATLAHDGAVVAAANGTATSLRAATSDANAGDGVLGAWNVRVQPPAYAAIAVQRYGDVGSVPALRGSRVTVGGAGSAPGMTVSVVNANAQGAGQPPTGTVSDGNGEWLAQVNATDGPLTVRLERGGKARLLIVEGRADSVPRVTLSSPQRDSVFRDARGVLSLAASAHDDIGLTRAHFELIVTSGEGERFTVRTLTLAARQWTPASGTREGSLRGSLDLATLSLQPGDVLHLRAVARDAHPDGAREFGSSETRAFRIARPAEYDSVAVEPAPPPEVDKSLLSQRMLLMLTEKLDKAQRRMERPDVLRESLKLARDQARLRLAVGDVVFQRLSGESSAEHAHSPGDGHDHGVEQQGGKLSLSASSTTGMLEEGNDSPVIAINQPLLEAYNAMWDAGRALEQGDPHGAIPPMKRALEAIERSRAASRLYLRGKPPQVIVDIAKVRLSGKDTGQVNRRSARSALPLQAARRDARLVRAAALAPREPLAARDSVALLRAESLQDAPQFAAALSTVLGVLEKGGDATTAFTDARRVLGNVVRTRATVWSHGGAP